MADERSATRKLGESLRKAQPYVDASWQLIGAVGLCTWGGWWLDKRFGTQPWLLVAGAALGFASGMLGFFRVILRLDAKEKAAKESKKERQ